MGWFDPVGVIARELAVAASAGFLIGGIDDLVIDLIWIGRSLWRNITVYAAIPAPTPARCRRLPVRAGSRSSCRLAGGSGDRRHGGDRACHASAIPTGGCMSAAIPTIRRRSPPSARAARRSHVRIVSATCRGRRRRRAASTGSGRRCGGRTRRRPPSKAVVLHDAEDIVHRDELTVYDTLIERFDAGPDPGPCPRRARGRRVGRVGFGPLLRRVRRGARQAGGGARGDRRRRALRRRRLRDRARHARRDRASRATPAVRSIPPA